MDADISAGMGDSSSENYKSIKNHCCLPHNDLDV